MHDLACVVHLHSLHSDGTGTVPEIARAAARAGADVVLLTDHDTLGARDAGEEGWHGAVLVLVGCEVSPPDGDHFLAFGIDRRIPRRGLDGPAICERVARAGGFGFAAHPFSRGNPRFRRAAAIPWRELECLEGLELWSFLNDTGEALPSLRAAARFVAAPQRYVDHPPPENLAAWDGLCRERRVVAVGGLDAHQFGRRIGPVVVRLMGYARSFRHLRTHVLVDAPLSGELDRDRDAVYGALRAGRCYIAMDSVGPPRGFRFTASGPSGELAMGAEAEAGEWTLRAQTPLTARIRLVKDGEPLLVVDGTALTCVAPGPGVYRVEARRRSRGAERTWILSNPIYLR